MAYTTIDDPTQYFNTVTYTGDDASTRNITGVGHQPDWVWIKNRGYANKHVLFDSVRGVNKSLTSNDNAAEVNQNSDGGYLSAFNSDGFTLTEGSSSDNDTNDDRYTYVAWNWKAGGSASSNSDGSITSSVSANTTAGFSIVSWTGTGSAATIGHGLGAVPTMIIVKNRDQTDDWYCYNVHNGNTHSILLNSNGAKVGAYTDNWNNTTPTSSVFSVGGSHATSGGSSEKMIAYCFTDIKGYSKFGSYTGNGSVSDSSSAVDGTFVYTGFKPSFIMWKNSSNSGAHWIMVDNKRSPFNKTTAGQSNGEPHLGANRSNAEETTEAHVDLLSNGFKFRSSSNNNFNYTGQTYIYMAFAEAPFVSSTGIPTTAR